MQERGRPRYPEKLKRELSLRTAALLSEISQKSGKKPAELEKIFKIGAGGIDSDTAGKYWRKLKNGVRCLTFEAEQKVKRQALELGWLGDEWILDAIVTDDNFANSLLKKTAAKKIEKQLKKIVQIMADEMPGKEEDHLYYCHRLGDRLAELYVEEWRNCCSGWNEPELEGSITKAKREAKSLLQICSTESEKS